MTMQILTSTVVPKSISDCGGVAAKATLKIPVMMMMMMST